jgi:hypothetical protein
MHGQGNPAHAEERQMIKLAAHGKRGTPFGLAGVCGGQLDGREPFHSARVLYIYRERALRVDRCYCRRS